MMRAMTWGLGSLLVVALAGVAAAGDDSDTIDVSKVKDDLVVVHDGDGHVIVVMPAVSGGDEYYFYGDGHTFHQQRRFSASSDGSTGRFSARAWSPRVDSVMDLERDSKGGWTMTCGKRETKLTEMKKDEAQKVIARATFRPPLWRHQAYALARDDRGTYYYVDRLRDEHGGKGFRLWKGKRGKMKQQKMLNIVSDSEGDIFSTRDGELRLILSRKDATWVKKKDRTELTIVPVGANVPLIYLDLGVYLGALGVPCDDM
jgi:hypothetical protein